MEINSNLSSDVCKEIIDKFEKDGRKRPGFTAGGLMKDIKNSIDLPIHRLEDWDKICEFLDDILKKNIAAYTEHVKNIFPTDFTGLDFIKHKHSGFQIQKSGYYKWHTDDMCEFSRVRMVTYIWYLNTIEEGGETGFHFKKVKPVEGKFVMFPATWDYPHCGYETENKYIITGWLWKNV